MLQIFQEKRKVSFIFYFSFFIFLDEKTVKNIQGVQENLNENQIIDNSKEINLGEKVKLTNKEFNNMKKRIHEINQKKNHKVKKNFCELSDEFFSEKIGEVSLAIL